MASGKLPPRQKMIGMMYLVLLALLALNVTKDILNAFVVVNQGLENNTTSFSRQTLDLYGEFDRRKVLDPVKVRPYWDKAQQAKKLTAELDQYIRGIKKILLERTEGIDAKTADTLRLAFVKNKDNYDMPTHVMIGDKEDGSGALAAELKRKLIAYKAAMNNLLDKEDRSLLHSNINTDNPVNTEDNQNWELYNFYHSPLAASITLLSKIQNDVKSTESDVLDLLLKEVNDDALLFDTIAAKVIPQSNYVLLGEQYKADIFIAAFNKTQQPLVAVGGGNIPVEKGMGKYLVSASREGFVKWNGTITVKSPKGKEMRFPFESEYLVAKPALMVSNEKLNIMYAGVSNPLAISVPGVPSENLIVSINNGNLQETTPGKFNAINQRIGNATISVSAKLDNGEVRNMGSMNYIVKPFPKPLWRFASAPMNTSCTKVDILKEQGVLAYYDPSFIYNANPKVVSFEMTISSKNLFGEQMKSGEGPSLTLQMKQALNRIRSGDVIMISAVKIQGPDGPIHNCGEVLIKVK